MTDIPLNSCGFFAFVAARAIQHVLEFQEKGSIFFPESATVDEVGQGGEVIQRSGQRTSFARAPSPAPVECGRPHDHDEMSQMGATLNSAQTLEHFFAIAGGNGKADQFLQPFHGCRAKFMGHARHFNLCIQDGKRPAADKQPDAHPVHHAGLAWCSIPVVS